MPGFREATVVAVTAERPGAVELDVELDGERATALAYPAITGEVGPGDQVLLNTAAVELGLGTGGVHFVVVVLGERKARSAAAGRVMKLRYTPSQVPVRSVEETDGDAIEAAGGLGRMPVVVAPLHSLIASIA